jgi:hypothetical protein
LFHEAIPQVEGKVFVNNTAEASDELVLERPYSAFGGVAAMGAGRYQLVINLFVDEEHLECGGAFIVKAHKFWVKSGLA